MFIGHFAVGLAAKPLAPRTSLPVLLAAPQLLDILWPPFVIAGIEHFHLEPGLMDASPLALDHIPWSHSLLMTAVWAVLASVAYGALTGYRRGAIVVGALVISHWVLDWASHRPDMPLYPGDSPRLGLGLWNSIPATLIVEGSMFAAGVWLYTRATRPRDRTGTVAWWALVAVLVVMYLGSLFGPPPPSANALTGVAFAGWLFLLWGWWIDRHRSTPSYGAV